MQLVEFKSGDRNNRVEYFAPQTVLAFQLADFVYPKTEDRNDFNIAIIFACPGGPRESYFNYPTAEARDAAFARLTYDLSPRQVEPVQSIIAG